jgi:hypothetical protein
MTSNLRYGEDHVKPGSTAIAPIFVGISWLDPILCRHIFKHNENHLPLFNLLELSRPVADTPTLPSVK